LHYPAARFKEVGMLLGMLWVVEPPYPAFIWALTIADHKPTKSAI
jgi:hypothetical protein